MFEELKKAYPPANKGKYIALQELIERLEKENKRPSTHEHRMSNNERIAGAKLCLSELTY